MFVGWLDSIVEWVTALMGAIGGPGVALALILECIFPPIPSELLLPLAGFTAATPDAPYSVLGAILWATLGSVAGAHMLYWLGALVGQARLVAIADRIPLLEANDIHRSVAWFNRHGRSAVFFGRLIPVVRSLISIPAGVDRMGLVSFTAYTLLGSALWNTVLVTSGYILQENWHAVTAVMDRFSTVVYIVIALAVVWVLYRLIMRRFRSQKVDVQ